MVIVVRIPRGEKFREALQFDVNKSLDKISEARDHLRSAMDNIEARVGTSIWQWVYVALNGMNDCAMNTCWVLDSKKLAYLQKEPVHF